MGIAETVAGTLEEYVQMAVRLAQQPDWRQSLSQKIIARKHLLHRQESVIRSLENFLTDAVATDSARR
jgi:predicted O-linked N-acetylglucosamine transferase (SPINDLY family)